MKTNKRLRKDLVFQQFGKKLVIFDGVEGNFYTFNETAGQIVMKIKKQWDLERIALFLKSKYQASQARIATDITRIIEKLDYHQLLK